jgi:CRP-like cAMP-binding protein
MDRFIRRMQHYVEISESDLAPLVELRHHTETYKSGQTIVALSEPMEKLYIPLEGWSIRSRYLDDGRRQIINFQLPGDYFDLMSIVGARSDHTITAAMDTKLRVYDGDAFLRAIQRSPKLASAFWWVTVQEETILRQQIVRIGRMNARERIANFILELNRRQTIAEGKPSDFVPLPVPQALMADALGLSVVHISRSLTQMRMQRLLSTSRRGIEILDRDAMINLAEFDPSLMENSAIRLVAQ